MASPIRDLLLSSNDDFRRLVQEHQTYAQRLDSLVSKPYLSEEDKLEEIRLKKMKLRLKDQMEQLEQQYRRSHSGAA
ncbi:MAG TPA: YdcH family protein [Clostridia bacterium]|nr:YdcH family protein [Clostridia bacterium]